MRLREQVKYLALLLREAGVTEHANLGRDVRPRARSTYRHANTHAKTHAQKSSILCSGEKGKGNWSVRRRTPRVYLCASACM